MVLNVFNRKLYGYLVVVLVVVLVVGGGFLLGRKDSSSEKRTSTPKVEKSTVTTSTIVTTTTVPVTTVAPTVPPTTAKPTLNQGVNLLIYTSEHCSFSEEMQKEICLTGIPVKDVNIDVYETSSGVKKLYRKYTLYSGKEHILRLPPGQYYFKQAGFSEENCLISKNNFASCSVTVQQNQFSSLSFYFHW